MFSLGKYKSKSRVDGCELFLNLTYKALHLQLVSVPLLIHTGGVDEHY